MYYAAHASAILGIWQKPPWLAWLLPYWLERWKDRVATAPPIAWIWSQYQHPAPITDQGKTMIFEWALNLSLLVGGSWRSSQLHYVWPILSFFSKYLLYGNNTMSINWRCLNELSSHGKKQDCLTYARIWEVFHSFVWLDCPSGAHWDAVGTSS